MNELHDASAPEAAAPAPAPAAASDPARIEAEPAPASPFTMLGGGTAFGSCDVDGNCD